MSSDKNDQEPSMEEILSSIRRIIADDEEEGAAGKQAAQQPAATKRSASKPPPPPIEDEPDDQDEDVLDLTQVVEQGGAKQTESAFEAEDAYAGDADDIELEPEEYDDEPEPEPAPPPRQPAKVKPLRAAVERSMLKDGTLVSAATATASTGAFAKLAKAAAGHDPAPLASGDKTVEQFLVELLRPMLKEWLDANLEGVVERVVEQEVKKLARRAELM
jgi:uncharacterized protein